MEKGGKVSAVFIAIPTEVVKLDAEAGDHEAERGRRLECGELRLKRGGLLDASEGDPKHAHSVFCLRFHI
jgi:hypothetical protein